MLCHRTGWLLIDSHPQNALQQLLLALYPKHCTSICLSSSSFPDAVGAIVWSYGRSVKNRCGCCIMPGDISPIFDGRRCSHRSWWMCSLAHCHKRRRMWKLMEIASRMIAMCWAETGWIISARLQETGSIWGVAFKESIQVVIIRGRIFGHPFVHLNGIYLVVLHNSDLPTRFPMPTGFWLALVWIIGLRLRAFCWKRCDGGIRMWRNSRLDARYSIFLHWKP
jgi:hypothetical protein